MRPKENCIQGARGALYDPSKPRKTCGSHDDGSPVMVWECFCPDCHHYMGSSSNPENLDPVEHTTPPDHNTYWVRGEDGQLNVRRNCATLAAQWLSWEIRQYGGANAHIPSLELRHPPVLSVNAWGNEALSTPHLPRYRENLNPEWHGVTTFIMNDLIYQLLGEPLKTGELTA